MAARNLKRQIAHFVPDPIMIFAKALGAAGANPTALVAPGVASIVWTATGRYTVTLEDKYNTLLQCLGNVFDATSPDDWEVNGVSETVATTKTILLAIFKGGALADLTTDDTLRLTIVLSNSERSR